MALITSDCDAMCSPSVKWPSSPRIARPPGVASLLDRFELYRNEPAAPRGGGGGGGVVVSKTLPYLDLPPALYSLSLIFSLTVSLPSLIHCLSLTFR